MHFLDVNSSSTHFPAFETLRFIRIVEKNFGKMDAKVVFYLKWLKENGGDFVKRVHLVGLKTLC